MNATKSIPAVVVLVVFAGCGEQAEPVTQHGEPARNVPPPKDLTPATDAPPVAPALLNSPQQAAEAKERSPDSIKPLTLEQQQQLLAMRLDGGMDMSFGRFANMFLALSRINLGYGVALATSSEEIAEAPLQSPFPSTYRPTLHEFLDAIALQTFSAWKYDPSSKYFESDVELETPVQDLAIFEFTPTKRSKPYEITLAEGWTANDRGNWVMYVPPGFPVGMDIYEMGAYSPEGDAAADEFFSKVRTDVTWEWAQRANDSAAKSDLKPAKVGAFDALYYESMVPSQMEKEIRWRHWVFMNEGKCYFIVSTIFPELEEKIYPDVEKMLASFRIKPQSRSPQ